MKKKTLSVIFFIAIFMIAGTAYTAEWVNISGNVYYENLPMSVMVLANGQHMFTGASDGRYQMDVPLNSNGEITIHAFCDGLASFMAVLKPWEAENYDIDMYPADAESNAMNVTVNHTPSAEPGWMKLSGQVRDKMGVPACAMVLANGQYTFSCEKDGAYDLEVPLGSGGKITLFVFCEGIQPYKYEWSVYFPDEKFEMAIRQAVNKPTGDILESDLLNLTYLNVSATYLDIEGIQYFTNLTSLELSGDYIGKTSAITELTGLTSLSVKDSHLSDINFVAGLTGLTSLTIIDCPISDLSDVAELTNLTSLTVNDTAIILFYNPMEDVVVYAAAISDLSAVAGLTDLTSLDFSGNGTKDISAVAGLTDLTSLDISGNRISDISTLAGLTNLTSLDISGNKISDISALAGLTNLTLLDISVNKISDISAVTGLTDLTWLEVHANPLSTTSCMFYIPELQYRVANVFHDCP